MHPDPEAKPELLGMDRWFGAPTGQGLVASALSIGAFAYGLLLSAITIGAVVVGVIGVIEGEPEALFFFVYMTVVVGPFAVVGLVLGVAILKYAGTILALFRPEQDGLDYRRFLFFGGRIPYQAMIALRPTEQGGYTLLYRSGNGKEKKLAIHNCVIDLRTLVATIQAGMPVAAEPEAT